MSGGEFVQAPTFSPDHIVVGISSCLLGHKVRFDGGHKRSSICQDEFSEVFDYLPVCPEIAIGLPVPRPAIRLQLTEQGERLLVSNDPQQDLTEAMKAFAARQLPALSGLSGYIVCAKSPSCGMERVKLTGQKGQSLPQQSVGMYTRQLMSTYPLLPVEENGRLNDPHLCDNFVTRVHVFHQWQALSHEGLSARKIIEFHSRHKFLILSHEPKAYRRLGPLVAALSENHVNDIAERYIQEVMSALKVPASRRNHTNVLQHIQGFFKKLIPSDERQAMAQVIEQYRLGKLPLMAPITLIRHMLVKFPQPYLAQQSYLQPYPDSLGLRNRL